MPTLVAVPQSAPPPTVFLRHIVLFYSHLRRGFPRFPTKTVSTFSSFRMLATCPAYIILDMITSWCMANTADHVAASIATAFVFLLRPSDSKYSPQLLVQEYPRYVISLISDTKFYTHTRQQTKLFFKYYSVAFNSWRQDKMCRIECYKNIYFANCYIILCALYDCYFRTLVFVCKCLDRKCCCYH